MIHSEVCEYDKIVKLLVFAALRTFLGIKLIMAKSLV